MLFFFVFLLARNELWQVIVTHDSVFVPECFVNVNAIWWSASLENKCFCCRTTLHLLCKAAVVCSLFSTTFSQREISTLYRCDWNLAQDKSLIKWVNILLDLLKTNSFFFNPVSPETMRLHLQSKCRNKRLGLITSQETQNYIIWFAYQNIIHILKQIYFGKFQVDAWCHLTLNFASIKENEIWLILV